MTKIRYNIESKSEQNKNKLQITKPDEKNV